MVDLLIALLIQLGLLIGTNSTNQNNTSSATNNTATTQTNTSTGSGEGESGDTTNYGGTGNWEIKD